MQMFGNPAKRNDECYTTEATAEYIVTKYIDLLKGKRIILPCDCEWSELYKSCKRHNLNCDIAQDMYNVDYSKYDLVFTNPPFHGVYKYIRFLISKNIKFLLFATWTIIRPIASLPTHDFYHKIYYLEDFSGDNIYKIFNTPDGTDYGVHWGLITNLDEGKAIVNAKPDIRIEATSTFQTYRGIWSDLIQCNYLKYTYRSIDEKFMVKYDGTETE